MTFNPNIPQLSDRPAISVGQFQANWNKLNNDFNVDHIAFTASSGNGEHTKVTFNNVIADPGLVNPKASLYIKTVAGDSELFFQKYHVATLSNITRQMTNLTRVFFANGGTAGGTGEYIDTPWGLRFIWGLTNNFNATATVICPAGTIVISTFQVTANTATGTPITIGALPTGPTTLTIGNNNLASVRYFIIGTY